MQPIGKYIVIEAVEDDLKTDSGIILSADDASQFRYKKGRVKKTGTDVIPEIKEDDFIYYDKSHSFMMLINGAQMTIIREIDVVVVC